jgi:hypothetical protein
LSPHFVSSNIQLWKFRHFSCDKRDLQKLTSSNLWSTKWYETENCRETTFCAKKYYTLKTGNKFLKKFVVKPHQIIIMTDLKKCYNLNAWISDQRTSTYENQSRQDRSRRQGRNRHHRQKRNWQLGTRRTEHGDLRGRSSGDDLPLRI